MGTYYTSYAILGVKIPVDHLLYTTEAPQCEHEIPEGANNCPMCGKEVGKYVTTHWDKVMHLRELINEQADHGYIWADRTDDPDNEGPPCFYYGFGISSDRDSVETKHFRVPDQGSILPTIRARTETFPMIDFNLWSDEVQKSYGFYSLTIGH